jgi:23S rRNA pseudouridine1911/1915/1917 synthase
MQEQEYQFENSGPKRQRLDRFLSDQLADFTRSRIQNLIRAGQVEVNGRTVEKTGLAVEPGASVRLVLPVVTASKLEPQDIPLDILFENEDVLVVNKAAGMVVHPAVGHPDGTLVQAALAHAPDMAGVGGEQRPGLVHRLDKDTSGVIVLAKNHQAHDHLARQFRDRLVNKTYLALSDGSPPGPEGIVDAAIGRDNHNRKRMAIVPDKKGRSAQTRYRIRQAFDAHTYFETYPVTGRTHQVRIHLAFIGCPIVGDDLYGRKRPSLKTKRQLLHAWRLGIILPNHSEARQFEAPIPADIQHQIDLLLRQQPGRRPPEPVSDDDENH